MINMSIDGKELVPLYKALGEVHTNTVLFIANRGMEIRCKDDILFYTCWTVLLLQKQIMDRIMGEKKARAMAKRAFNWRDAAG